MSNLFPFQAITLPNKMSRTANHTSAIEYKPVESYVKLNVFLH